MPPKRQIKKTVIQYTQDDQSIKPSKTQQNRQARSRSRSRQNRKQQAITENQREKYTGNNSLKDREQTKIKVQEVSITSRRQRLKMMRQAQMEQQQMPQVITEVQVKLQEKQILPLITQQPKQVKQISSNQSKKIAKKQVKHSSQSQRQQQDSNEEEDKKQVMSKPLFISKEYRQPNEQQIDNQQQKKKKSIKYNTKLLLQQTKYHNSEEENEETDSQFENQTDIPDDDDNINEEYQFQLWKIRQLKRIRRAQQEMRKHQMEKKQTERRRQMTNEQIFVQNRALGSDATDNTDETKYVFMQKYYHKGAFYQDSQDQVFKRDYNLPTPMQMQDKSMLPQLLQKRIGNFGKKGQSKYTHLTAEDTSDLNPLTRPDQSLLQFWKRKTAGYKGSYGNNL